MTFPTFFRPRLTRSFPPEALGMSGISWSIIPVSKWLITMVSKSPRPGVVGPLPNGLSKWLINGGDPNYLLNGMILQVGTNSTEKHPGWWTRIKFFSGVLLTKNSEATGTIPICFLMQDHDSLWQFWQHGSEIQRSPPKGCVVHPWQIVV